MKVSIIPWIVRKLKLCFALVEDGDTASQNIAQGKFVIWKGVCCKAASAITAGETLSGTNLPAISDGALNDISASIPSVVNNLTSDSTTSALSAAQGKALNDNKANFSTVLKDTRLPSTNQQIENILIGTSRNIMYLGNTSTIDDVIVQTKNGDVSIPSLNDKTAILLGTQSFANAKAMCNYFKELAGTSFYLNRPLFMKVSVPQPGDSNLFATSSFMALAEFSSVNYGSILCMSDNKISGGIKNICIAVSNAYIESFTPTEVTISL